MNSDGAVSEGASIGVGGGTDHIRTATAQPRQNEGGQKALQVWHQHFHSDYLVAGVKWNYETNERLQNVQSFGKGSGLQVSDITVRKP